MEERIAALEENARLLSTEMVRLRREVEELKDQITMAQVSAMGSQERMNAIAEFDIEGGFTDPENPLRTFARLHIDVARQAVSDALNRPMRGAWSDGRNSVWKQTERPQTSAPETPRTVET